MWKRAPLLSSLHPPETSPDGSPTVQSICHHAGAPGTVLPPPSQPNEQLQTRLSCPSWLVVGISGQGPRAGWRVGPWGKGKVLVYVEGCLGFHPPYLELTEILCLPLVPLYLVIKILPWEISGIHRSRGNYYNEHPYSQWADSVMIEIHHICS